MLVSIPKLNAGEDAKAIVTFEVTRYELLAPADTATYRVPAKSGRELTLSAPSTGA